MKDYRRRQNELELGGLAKRRGAFCQLPASEQHRRVSRVVEKAFAVRSRRIRLAILHNVKGEWPDGIDIERRERNLYSCGFKRDQVGNAEYWTLMAMRAGYDVLYRDAEAKMWCRPPREVDP